MNKRKYYKDNVTLLEAITDLSSKGIGYKQAYKEIKHDFKYELYSDMYHNLDNILFFEMYKEAKNNTKRKDIT